MRVMVIVKATADSEQGNMPSTELLEAMGQFNEQLVKAGIMVDGAGLKPSSQGYRVQFSGDDRWVVQGPFAETKELIAGYWIWNVADMEDAIQWVRKCPNPMPTDSEIEIRPFYEMEDFGDQLTPELKQKEVGLMAQTMGLPNPEFQFSEGKWVVGVSRHYTMETRCQIPEQWQQFVQNHGPADSNQRIEYFGVSYNPGPDCDFDYLTGFQMQTGKDQNLQELTKVELPAGQYVIFHHQGHVSSIPEALETIYSKWVPQSGLHFSDSPCFERYTEQYDATTGMGGIEFWLPLKA